ncbi:hypothetical protein [Urechidicola vernalis]|uniref:Uncharacterized protein n=1 Tax=Urechidicola vernalis TaxID=3075600 RepID=A0ABU2Y1V0_9FLAO|nr:hypothetical protein [Urechidicola sp. P050]MDT0551760.1 hypothetical protein [Urechidicola sp. P050]
MKNSKLNTIKNTEFIVAVDQINNSRALLPFVLFKKMESYSLYATLPYKEFISSKPNLTKLEILKNAFLNDKLQIKSHLKKLNEKEIHLSVQVVKELNDCTDIICKATFSFTVNGLNLYKAS